MSVITIFLQLDGLHETSLVLHGTTLDLIDYSKLTK